MKSAIVPPANVATYHLSGKVFSRSSGHLAVAKAAYRAGARLYDERVGLVQDFSKKRGVIHAEILAPKSAPEWVYDREKLWNAVEAHELRKDATLAREIEVAIPRELSREGRLELVREFARDEFVARGMIADVCVHEVESDKPHAHIMLTMREVGPEGFGLKVRAWNDRALFCHWRSEWADRANRALAREGHEERIDHRSYANRGIELEPQPKLYRSPEEAASVDGRDVVEEKLEEYQRVARENGERIFRDPSIALRLVTQQQATFTNNALLKVLNTHTADQEQFDRVLSAVMASPELVRVHDDQGRERFTTREMLACESALFVLADDLQRSTKHDVSEGLVEQAIRLAPRELELSCELSADQQAAVRHVTRGGGLVLVEGYAGAGKSTMLAAARLGWEAQGLEVVGGALAGKAAEGLESASGIRSRTLASWELAWKRGKHRLTDKHVLVIDEAGMVGTRQLAGILAEASRAGAKVVLVGDSRQLQAIDAGAPFRVLSEELGAEKLTDIRRQRVDWQRNASVDFASGSPHKALRAYHEHGQIHAHETRSDALAKMARAWNEHRLEHPRASSLMLAYQRAEVEALNRHAVKLRQARGELGHAVTVQTEEGERSFAVRGRIFFGRNDRDVGVTNGSLGTIEHVQGDELFVRLDSGKVVVVDTKEYKDLDHGYAVTVHKSQGVTVDRVFAYANKLFDATAAYVAMSRHRDGVDLYWSKDHFRSQSELDRALSRERPKEMAVERELQPEPTRTAALHARIETLTGELAKSRAVTPDELIEGSEPVKKAQAAVENASEHFAEAVRRLDEYNRSSWTVRMRRSDKPLLDAHDKAKRALLEATASLHQLRKSPELLKAARAAAGRHNTTLAKKHAELKELRKQAGLDRPSPSSYQPSRRHDRGRGGGWER